MILNEVEGDLLKLQGSALKHVDDLPGIWINSGSALKHVDDFEYLGYGLTTSGKCT